MPFNLTAFNLVATVIGMIADTTKGVGAVSQKVNSTSVRSLFDAARAVEADVEEHWKRLSPDDIEAILKRFPDFNDKFIGQKENAAEQMDMLELNVVEATGSAIYGLDPSDPLYTRCQALLEMWQELLHDLIKSTHHAKKDRGVNFDNLDRVRREPTEDTGNNPRSGFPSSLSLYYLSAGLHRDMVLNALARAQPALDSSASTPGDQAGDVEAQLPHALPGSVAEPTP